MRCQVRKCWCEDIYLLYYGKPVCSICWSRHCSSSFLKDEFKIDSLLKKNDKNVNMDFGINKNVNMEDWKEVFSR